MSSKYEGKPIRDRSIDTSVALNNSSMSRRSLLTWLGKGTVLALSSELLSACADGISWEPTVATIQEGTTLGSFDFPFYPSSTDHPAYDEWWLNTVDRQELEDILLSWKLEISGLVEEPMTLSFTDLLSLPRQDQVTDFHCVEGWSVLDVPWNGIHMSQIINLVKPTSAATHITVNCHRGIYSESVPISVAQESKSMLAYGVGGATLPLDHGFPLRMVIPRMYGYKGAKWVNGLVFTDAEIDGYWEQRGYDSDASVSSSRLREGKY